MTRQGSRSSSLAGLLQSYSCAIVTGVPKRSTIPHPLPDPLIDLIAYRFRVLSEPMRIKLLDRLREGAATVSELQEATGSSQQNVSKHLSVLAQAGLVGRQRDGSFVRYEITDESVFSLCEEVCGGLRRQLRELDLLLEGGTAR
jgi:DNA-binding transcriptional ArsR family regulator